MIVYISSGKVNGTWELLIWEVRGATEQWGPEIATTDKDD